MQTKWQSFIESLLNVAIGFGVMFGAQKLIFPLVGVHVNTQTNLKIGAAFTVVSVVRSYFVRRLFNSIHNKGAK